MHDRCHQLFEEYLQERSIWLNPETIWEIDKVLKKVHKDARLLRT